MKRTRAQARERENLLEKHHQCHPQSARRIYIYRAARREGFHPTRGWPFYIEKYVQWTGLTAILLCWWGKKYEANE